ncbi:MAG: hypothetical protein IPM96_19705 [Ignavibacteria bacterium]|nr:hypothetical protein [Ignavibacteria bacterium]
MKKKGEAWSFLIKTSASTYRTPSFPNKRGGLELFNKDFYSNLQNPPHSPFEKQGGRPGALYKFS